MNERFISVCDFSEFNDFHVNEFSFFLKRSKIREYHIILYVKSKRKNFQVHLRKADANSSCFSQNFHSLPSIRCGHIKLIKW